MEKKEFNSAIAICISKHMIGERAKDILECAAEIAAMVEKRVEGAQKETARMIKGCCVKQNRGLLSVVEEALEDPQIIHPQNYKE